MEEEGAGPEPSLIRGLKLLSYVPPTWTYECDEDLIHFLYDHLGKEDENLGSVKQYVESIDVSSYTVGAWTPLVARYSHIPQCWVQNSHGQTIVPTGHT